MSDSSKLCLLVIGSGGREHALVQMCGRSPLAGRVLAAPGNGGMAAEVPCFDVAVEDVDGLVDLARREAVDLGPARPRKDEDQRRIRRYPMPGAEGWQNSNPPILSLAAVKDSYDLFYEVGMEKLRQKSLRLTGYLESLLQQIDGVTVFTPENPDARGAQLSLRVRGGKEVFEHLSKNGVICDWREPDCIRIAPAPFYNSFEDVFQFAQILEKALKQSSQKEAS